MNSLQLAICQHALETVKCCQDKEVKDLSEHEKTCICIMAGMEMDINLMPDGKVVMKTVHSCGIVKEDKSFNVIVAPRLDEPN